MVAGLSRVEEGERERRREEGERPREGAVLAMLDARVGIGRMLALMRVRGRACPVCLGGVVRGRAGGLVMLHSSQAITAI